MTILAYSRKKGTLGMKVDELCYPTRAYELVVIAIMNHQSDLPLDMETFAAYATFY